MDDRDTSSALLRPYAEADLPGLLEIAVAAWQPVYDAYRAMLGPELFELACREWQANKRRQIEAGCRGERDARVAVVELDGEPVGFITYYFDTGNGVAEIGNNAVHPEHQGEGIGTRMYEYALARMREAGVRCVKVTTGGDSSHAPARRAYEKAGFSRYAPSVTYYREL